MSQERLLQLLDKQEISEVLARYFRGADRMDRELVRSCYHSDAVDVHGGFEGGVEEYIEWSFALLRKYTSTFHFMGNVLIELDGDRARSETYGVAYHRKAGGRPQDNLITGFRFIDDFERRDGGAWRIARRLGTTEWCRVDDEAGWWPFPEPFASGRRDRSDPVYAPLGALPGARA